MSQMKVLFVCIHNSARSQMAMTFLNYLGNGKFEAESAGLEPGNLNPFVIQAMKEYGIDISNNPTNGVLEFYKQGRVYDYVITVCDKEAAERCPIFPSNALKLHWSFPDPSALSGTDEEKLKGTIVIRNQIHKKIEEWIAEIAPEVSKGKD